MLPVHLQNDIGYTNELSCSNIFICTDMRKHLTTSLNIIIRAIFVLMCKIMILSFLFDYVRDFCSNRTGGGGPI